MSDEIRTGLLQDVRELDPRTLSASADADGNDGSMAPGGKKKHDGDSTDASDADGTDAGDSDATDKGGDSDGSDKTDSDGTDGGDADGTDNA